MFLHILFHSVNKPNFERSGLFYHHQLSIEFKEKYVMKRGPSGEGETVKYQSIAGVRGSTDKTGTMSEAQDDCYIFKCQLFEVTTTATLCS